MPIVNPNNLHIDAFYCESYHSKKQKILLDMHVRDFSNKAIIINGDADLSDADDLVRLAPIIELNFEVIGKTVLAGKQKIGRVTEYAIDHDSLFIKKLYVQPPLWKGINSNSLVFDRKSVIEVTDTHIIVSGPEEKVGDVARRLGQRAELTGYSANTSLISEKE